MNNEGFPFSPSRSSLVIIHSMPSSNHALVVGASGLIGWAVVEQLLLDSSFSKVTALVNRPLSLQDSFWPLQAPGRPALSLISGVDLRCSTEELIKRLRDEVADAYTISHVFYFGKTFKYHGSTQNMKLTDLHHQPSRRTRTLRRKPALMSQ